MDGATISVKREQKIGIADSGFTVAFATGSTFAPFWVLLAAASYRSVETTLM